MGVAQNSEKKYMTKNLLVSGSIPEVGREGLNPPQPPRQLPHWSDLNRYATVWSHFNEPMRDPHRQ